MPPWTVLTRDSLREKYRPHRISHGKTHTDTNSPYNFSRKRRWNKEHTHWKKMEWSRWNERVLSSSRSSVELSDCECLWRHISAAVMFAPGGRALRAPQLYVMSVVDFLGNPAQKCTLVLRPRGATGRQQNKEWLSQNFFFFSWLSPKLDLFMAANILSGFRLYVRAHQGQLPPALPEKSTTVSGALHDDDETADISFSRRIFFFWKI